MTDNKNTAAQPLDLDRATIREIFMRHGFKIKEGQTDLKPYVYEAAAALIAQARASQPEGATLASQEKTTGAIQTAEEASEAFFAQERTIHRLEDEIAGLRAQLAHLKPWYDAVTDACVVSGELPWDENDARGSLAKLIAWQEEIALDPKVSERAAQLAAKGHGEPVAQPANAAIATLRKYWEHGGWNEASAESEGDEISQALTAVIWSAAPTAPASAQPAEQISDAELSTIVELARATTDAHCDSLPSEPTKEYSNAYFFRALARADEARAQPDRGAAQFDHAKFMQMVREFAEVCYGVRRSTEDVGKNLIDYVKSLAAPSPASQPVVSSCEANVAPETTQADDIQYLKNVAGDAVPMLSAQWPKTATLLKDAVEKVAAHADDALRKAAIYTNGAWHVPMHMITSAHAQQEAAPTSDQHAGAVAWEYCPECGSYETHEPSEDSEGQFFCAVCNQEWHSHIDYTDVVRKHLGRRLAAPAAIDQAGAQPVAHVVDNDKGESIINAALPVGTEVYLAAPTPAADQDAQSLKSAIIAACNFYEQNMEADIWYGANMGVPCERYEEVADEVIKSLAATPVTDQDATKQENQHG